MIEMNGAAVVYKVVERKIMYDSSNYHGCVLFSLVSDNSLNSIS